MFEKKILLLRLVFYSIRAYFSILTRALTTSFKRTYYQFRFPNPTKPEDSKDKNIIIIGASFAGYFAAKIIATSLPPNSPFRVVVIEPHSHFNFTWVFPRFCVVKEHEHKAFIPYGRYVPAELVRWVQARVERVEKEQVVLTNGQRILYEYLLVATGSGATDGLPSRAGVDEKKDGVVLLREMQDRIEEARHLVVVGGGAAGVELAADAKHLYRDKNVVLVHSRQAVMNRFGVELQVAALKGLEDLGVEVILGERLVSENVEGKTATLSSGREVRCDFLIHCGGQKPSSSILSSLTPSSITPSGHLSVKPTLQILDNNHPNIYVCGDVADTGEHNPNARHAMQQAKIAADNIVLAARGKSKQYKYKPHWAESVIKLTLGLDKSVTHFGKDGTELLFPAVENDLALMCDGSWRHWGVVPFEDEYGESKTD
ncbi:FAD/NAD(P)-binding protein [Glarea lozoyensis ATCC 20868]|uniref:FAD/NAD(P)-binding protein n=1 Tax=Glarea lozoyensis (strain ATCC 20868 / MF5171) TaxID=1116229 RepID=S3D747_GLAL2|nr:FAD/NAD(P)-binding protein [Glarea lozoyensis ATCC 20868]EPE34307.1 FAD/NAD(P)-binding protein [Glarea lozoyensis ATCC 20868]